jgi:membrane protease YdiL (CAAX protease family)
MRRYPLLSYFALAYAITWGGVLVVVGPSGLRSGDLAMPRGMLVWIAMLAGPSIAGLVLTAVVAGRDGLRDLRRRLGRWRVPPRWYATLLITPLIGSAIVAGLTLVSADFRPWLMVERDKTLVLGMFVALVVGAGVEELGWTGYATPRLRLRYGSLGAAVLLGSLHGGWHFLADFSGRGDAAPLLYVSRFVIFWLVGLIALRLLMVWVYEHTESLLLGQLIHASYTAPLFLLTPPAASPAQLLLLWTLFTAAFTAFVVVLVRSGAHSRLAHDGAAIG